MKFTFLTQEQVFGENKLSIFNKYSAESTITDFALLLGGSNTNYIMGVQQQHKVSWWWTKTPNFNGDSVAIKADDLMMSLFINHREVGARPTFKYSDIKTKEYSYNDEISMIYYGEYPQTVVSSSYAGVLESAYHKGTIKLTGKQYTTDLVDVSSCFKKFLEKTYDEYEYGGKKYIRFVSDITRYYQQLSDNRIIRKDEVYWIEIEPIKWLIDKDADIAISESVLFAGVQFNNQRNYTGDFDKTDIKQYIDKYFSKDIIPSISDTIEKSTREEYENVLNNYTTRLYSKSNDILNKLNERHLRKSDKTLELIVAVRTVLEETDKILKIVYKSHYINREKVVAYFEKQLNNLNIIEFELNCLSLDLLGLEEFKVTKDEYINKRKIKRLPFI